MKMLLKVFLLIFGNKKWVINLVYMIDIHYTTPIYLSNVTSNSDCFLSIFCDYKRLVKFDVNNVLVS